MGPAFLVPKPKETVKKIKTTLAIFALATMVNQGTAQSQTEVILPKNKGKQEAIAPKKEPTSENTGGIKLTPAPKKVEAQVPNQKILSPQETGSVTIAKPPQVKEAEQTLTGASSLVSGQVQSTPLVKSHTVVLVLEEKTALEVLAALLEKEQKQFYIITDNPEVGKGLTVPKIKTP